MNTKHLTLERLKELFYYNPKTGVFTRKVSVSFGTYAGDIAGTPDKDGYVRICIDYKLYGAHRLAWFYMTGNWPTKQIDHKDRISNNNKFDNLREASNYQNSANKESKSKCPGVSKRGKKWRAKIVADGKEKRLGTFATPELASAAYVAAKRELQTSTWL